MNDADVIAVLRDAVIAILLIGGPVMVVGLIVGVAISLLQALTQIQEMTLAFVPKIIAIYVAMIVLFPFMLSTMTGSFEGIADRIVAIGLGG